MFPLPNVRPGARLPTLCFSLSCIVLWLAVLLPAQTHAQTQNTEFDDYHAMYEAVFSTLDDSYLTTGILGERAFPVYPFHTRFGNLPYHDSLATIPSTFPWAVGMIEHMTTDSATHLSPWLDRDFYDRTDVRGTSDTLHLAAIAMQFDRFIDSAEHMGLIHADTAGKRIYDVLPRPHSPYRLDMALIFSSLTAKLQTGPTVVSLDKRDLMSNFTAADELAGLLARLIYHFC